MKATRILALLAALASGAASAAPVNQFLFEGAVPDADTGSAPLAMTSHGTIVYANDAPAGALGQSARFTRTVTTITPPPPDPCFDPDPDECPPIPRPYDVESGTYIRADGTPFNRVSGDFTVAFWMKTGMTSSTGGQWWQGNGLVDAETAGHTSDWGISLLNNKVVFGIGTSTDLTIQSAAAVNDDEWHFVVASWELASGAMSLYVDDGLSATGTAGAGVARSNGNHLTLGAGAKGGNFYDGHLAEVQIYAEALSPQDLAPQVQAVPEPGSFALVLAALGLLGWSSRRGAGFRLGGTAVQREQG